MSGKKMSKKVKHGYRALIIGAGRIAALFDTPKSADVITHAHAYAKHGQIGPLAFFDVNKKAADAAAKRWGAQAFYSLQEARQFKPDIVSVCVPDKSHYSVLKKILALCPKVVICEKPLTGSIMYSKKILRMYRVAEIPTVVNYSRRFDVTVQRIKADIESGVYGKVLCARAIYGKGLLHNGSHIIDLCQYLFGPVTGMHGVYSFSDYKNKADKNVAAFLTFKQCPQFHLAVGDERQFSIFEFDIFLEKKRYTLFDSGGCYVSTQRVESDPLYAGYRCLGKSITVKTRSGQAAMRLVDNAVKVLEHTAQPVCDMNDAYEAQKVCFNLLRNF